MKRILLALLTLALLLNACSRPLPSSPAPLPPTKEAAENQPNRPGAPSPARPSPTRVKVTMVTVTAWPRATPTPLLTAAALPTATPTPLPTAAVLPTASPTPPPPPEGIVTGDLVNLRSGPDTGYAVIGEAALSQTLQIIARDFKGDWWQICCPNDEEESAWISAEFVQITQPFTSAADLVPVIEFPQSLSGVISSGEINLRSGPGTQYELVGKILLGKTVEIIGRSQDNNWWQINHPAKKGERVWVYTQYVLTNFDPADAKRRLPAIEPPPLAAPTSTPPISSTTGISLSVTGLISGDIVNLRKGPGTAYALVGQVELSQTAQIVGRNEGNTWLQLCCQGDDGQGIGWISAEFVLIDKAADLSQIPLITQSATPEESLLNPVSTADKELTTVNARALTLISPSIETGIETDETGIENTAAPESKRPETVQEAAQADVSLRPSAENALPAYGSFAPPGNINPLTGLPLPTAQQSQSPIIVCINNDPQARPQYGISQADVMYEYLMEGYYITRYSGLFYGESPSQIGPVRSARLINYYMGALYKAPLFCSGASDQVRFLLKNQAPFAYLDVDLDDGSNSHYSVSIGADYRTRLRTSAAGLRQWTEDWGIEKPANIRGFTFGELPDGGLKAATIAIPYVKATGSQVSYIYDPKAGRYLRFLGEQAHTDANTGKQIAVENVIAQYVTHQDTDIVEDSLGSTSIRLDLFGGGEAIVFRDGVAFFVAWSSDTQGDTPRFFDAEGREIPLKAGKTWISVVPGSYEIEFGEDTPGHLNLP